MPGTVFGNRCELQRTLLGRVLTPHPLPPRLRPLPRSAKRSQPRQDELDDALGVKRHGWQLGAAENARLLRERGAVARPFPSPSTPPCAKRPRIAIHMFPSTFGFLPLAPSAFRNCRCGSPPDPSGPSTCSLCCGWSSGTQGLRSRERSGTGPESHSTSAFSTTAVRKLWRTARQCSTVLNWHLVQQWCPCSSDAAEVAPRTVQLRRWRTRLHGGPKRAAISPTHGTRARYDAGMQCGTR